MGRSCGWLFFFLPGSFFTVHVFGEISRSLNPPICREYILFMVCLSRTPDRRLSETCHPLQCAHAILWEFSCALMRHPTPLSSLFGGKGPRNKVLMVRRVTSPRVDRISSGNNQNRNRGMPPDIHSFLHMAKVLLLGRIDKIVS
jgi:hypothetical protein